MNRFRKAETIEVAGFSLAKYGSLLFRERERLIEIRRDLLDSTQILLNFSSEMAEGLNIPIEDAWRLINASISEGDEQLLNRALPWLSRLKTELEPEYRQRQYPFEAVSTLLQSRLDPSWLKQVAPELQEAYGIAIAPAQLKAIQSVPFVEWLDSPIRAEICRSIAHAIDEFTFDALLEFLSGEERQWKPLPEVEAEEVDATDPLDLGSDSNDA